MPFACFSITALSCVRCAQQLIGEDLRTAWKLQTRVAGGEDRSCAHVKRVHNALDAEDPAGAMAVIIASDGRRRTMQLISAHATSK